MPQNNSSTINWNRFGLQNDDDEPVNYRQRSTAGGREGFIDMGNESQYAAGGHHASGANEIFADEQGDKPWWRTNFFISQPVLFGTWDGVFTSCMINVFGVIVFLRSGWIVAQAGIINGFLIIFCTVVIALISVLSAVGICERCRVESGGVYFLIAHTLGSKFGGSLGLLYCFGQAVGCALNVLGFGESMAELVGLAGNPWAIKGFAIGAVFVIGLINVAGVKWVIKLQFVLLLILLVSAFDFMFGSFTAFSPAEGIDGWGSSDFMDNLWANYTDGYSWFRVFGVFFPTVTGVLSGINMSGDLRAPSTDIPNGTLAAFGTSTFLYLIFILFLGATCNRQHLLTDFVIAVKVSAVKFLLLAGIYVSSMSSCLGAMYGTPRVLQSIAKESVIPGLDFLGNGRGPNKVPVYAMAVVATVTTTFIIVGDINFLAPIVTMPFLLTYASIDYSYFALAQTFDIQEQREERFRIQAQSPSYETRRYGSVDDEDDNDLDILFPDRVRHKTVQSSSNIINQDQTTSRRVPSNIETESNGVAFRNGGTPSSTNSPDGDEDDEPIAPIRPPIHQKTKNWYSGFCNRWASLLGAFIKISVMMLVNWMYALACFAVVFLIWLYVGTANPAVKPGLTAEFHFFIWLKNLIFRCFGKRNREYEHIIVTPTFRGVDVSPTQLNEDNEDFADRQRFGLQNDDDEPVNYRQRSTAGGREGFIDMGNESQYAAGGHHASGANEIFADEQGDKPWWRTNFFISQPVLFGTWDGVFTSCMINVFGVIVFLRSGWIVAQAGIINGFLIIFCTVVIALISVLSAVGICERCRVESGGVYFLIAHTLGSKFGGSLGLLYCFGQAVGCALNVLGFGESMAELVGLAGNPWAIKGFAIGAVFVIGLINVAGVKWVIKLQFVLLLILLVSAFDFMFGSFTAFSPAEGIDGWGSSDFVDNLWANYTDGYSWFRVFGVFFPTVTGVLSGINMSGDLRAPSTDIPNGTLAAFGTSTFLYLIFILFLGATCNRQHLLTDFVIAVKVSAVKFLLLAGIYVSSMSSCLGAMYGTPRVLQSIAKESVIPGLDFLGNGRGPNKVPVYAMAVVATVTTTFIIVGDINFLAPIVTMPFLLTYASIDYSYFALAQTFDIQEQREERFRIQAQSPSYETRRYGSVDDEDDNDLDILFPDRVRHKTVQSSSNIINQDQTTSRRVPSNIETESNGVAFRNGGTPSSTNSPDGDEDDEPIAPIRPPIHQKTKNWYSGFCNRWASLLGAFIKISVMMLVNWMYALACFAVVFLIWLYVGTANPAVKPGLTAEFHFFIWLKNLIFRCFGKRNREYEQIIVTPTFRGVDVSPTQLNEDNEDFADRQRYHHISVVPNSAYTDSI